MDRIKISVIICTYNYVHLLPQCLESVFDQAWPADEIIIVDDGSTDRIYEIINRFGI
jgi:glycosyltransferase involved in cell wall biosynthesis